MYKNKLIILQSITYATKARNFLLKQGIHSDIVKTPKTKNMSTCGYSLSLSKDFDKAYSILTSNGFKILGTDNGEDL